MPKFSGPALGAAADVDAVHRAALHTVAARAAAQMRDENFPVAMRLLPRAVAADLGAVYRYARFVDDIGDDAALEPDVRLELLDAVERDVHALADHRALLAPVADLAPMLRAHDIPTGPLVDLIMANRVDQRVDTYDSFADLLGYCALSAAPVGRLVLHRAHAATAANIDDSDAVCAALQVLEHCQDVGEDASAGRVYLPAVELRRAGVTPDVLRGTTTPPALARVVAVQVSRSRELLRPGSALVTRLDGWARLAVAGYVAGGLATADALQAAGFAVLERTVTPSKARTAWHALRLLGRRR